MEEIQKETTDTRDKGNEGISFKRLMPFISDKFKDDLVEGKVKPEHYFKFRNEASYKSFINTIKSDIYDRKNAKKPLFSRLFNFIE